MLIQKKAEKTETRELKHKYAQKSTFYNNNNNKKSFCTSYSTKVTKSVATYTLQLNSVVTPETCSVYVANVNFTKRKV